MCWPRSHPRKQRRCSGAWPPSLPPGGLLSLGSSGAEGMAASEAPLPCVAQEASFSFWAWKGHRPMRGSLGMLSAPWCHLGPVLAASPSGAAGQLRGEPGGLVWSLYLRPPAAWLSAPWCHLGPLPAASPFGAAGQLRGEPGGLPWSLSLRTAAAAAWRGNRACGKQTSAACKGRQAAPSSPLEGSREWSCRSW